MRGKILYWLIHLLFFTGCISNNPTPQKYTILHEAVRLGQADIVKSIIKNNPNINKKDNFGETPLVDAVRFNFTKIVKLLVCNGADKNVTTLENISLFKMAIRNENKEIYDILKADKKTICFKKNQINKIDKTKKNTIIKKINVDENATLDINIENEEDLNLTKLNMDGISDKELEQYIKWKRY